MKTTFKHVQHANIESSAKPLHVTLRSRATALLATGCLVAALSPAVAFAAPGGQMGQMGPQQGGTSPIEQQAPGNGQPGQAPQSTPPDQASPGDWDRFADDQQQGDDSQQTPSGVLQLPSGEQKGRLGQPGQPQESAVDDQVRQILSEQYGVDVALPGSGMNPQAVDAFDQSGIAVEPPEIPEGQVNVQAVIDSVRDVLRQYDAATLESADFDDEEFAAALTEYVQAAVEQRLEAFANGVPQTGSTLPDNATNSLNASDAGGADDSAQSAPSELPSLADVSSSVLQQLIAFVVGLFS